MKYLIEWTINQLSAGAAIITFLIVIIYKTYKGKKIALGDVVIAVLAGGMLPLALGFTIYPFNPNFIGPIEEMSLQITVTGLILLHIYVKTIREKIKSDSS